MSFKSCRVGTGGVNAESVAPSLRMNVRKVLTGSLISSSKGIN